MSEKTKAARSAQIAQVMEYLGRCVAIYQQVELHLKLLLPHLVPPGQESPSAMADDWKVLIASKQTLGALANMFTEVLAESDRVDFGSYLTELIAHRNEVIHHFYWQPFSKLESEADIGAALAYLRHRIRFAGPFAQSLENATRTFTTELERSMGHSPQHLACSKLA